MLGCGIAYAGCFKGASLSGGPYENKDEHTVVVHEP